MCVLEMVTRIEACVECVEVRCPLTKCCAVAEGHVHVLPACAGYDGMRACMQKCMYYQVMHD